LIKARNITGTLVKEPKRILKDIFYHLSALAARCVGEELQKMNRTKQLGTRALAALVLILFLIFMGNVQPVVENPKAHKAVFYVS